MIRKKIALVTLILFAVAISFNTAEAAARGKWDYNLEERPDGTTWHTFDCKYSLFTKDCSTELYYEFPTEPTEQ